ncbi:nucleic acid-binding, partial [Striga asiatica]
MTLFNMISELKPRNMHWGLRVRLVQLYSVPLYWGLRVRLVRLYSVPMYNDKSKISTLECVFNNRTLRGSYSRRGELRTSFYFPHYFARKYALKTRTFIIAENKMTYKTTTAPYRIFFVPRSNISEFKDDSFPTMIYDFIPFQRLVDETVLINIIFYTKSYILLVIAFTNENLKPDVIGRLAVRYPPREVDYGGLQTILMEILLEDHEGNTMSCTLWGSTFKGELRYEHSATLAEELESPKSVFKTTDQLHATEELINVRPGATGSVRETFSLIVVDNGVTSHTTDLIGKTANNLKSKADYEAEANVVPKEILKLATADPELLDKYYGGPQESGNSDLLSKLKSVIFSPMSEYSNEKVNTTSTSIDEAKLSS